MLTAPFPRKPFETEQKANSYSHLIPPHLALAGLRFSEENLCSPTVPWAVQEAFHRSRNDIAAMLAGVSTFDPGQIQSVLDWLAKPSSEQILSLESLINRYESAFRNELGSQQSQTFEFSLTAGHAPVDFGLFIEPVHPFHVWAWEQCPIESRPVSLFWDQLCSHLGSTFGVPIGQLVEYELESVWEWTLNGCIETLKPAMKKAIASWSLDGFPESNLLADDYEGSILESFQFILWADEFSDSMALLGAASHAELRSAWKAIQRSFDLPPPFQSFVEHALSDTFCANVQDTTTPIGDNVMCASFTAIPRAKWDEQLESLLVNHNERQWNDEVGGLAFRPTSEGMAGLRAHFRLSSQLDKVCDPDFVKSLGETTP